MRTTSTKDAPIRLVNAAQVASAPTFDEKRTHASRKATNPRRRTAGRISDLVLEQLPMAVVVIDDAVQVRYCNPRAGTFFQMPDFIVHSMPPLVELLQGCSRLPAQQRAKLVSFCSEQIASFVPGEREKILRLSLTRNLRLVVRLCRMDHNAWLLMIEDTAGAGGATSAPDAWLDPLTGLANRRRFNQILAQEIRDAEPESRLSLLMIDLDRFKTVNETLGHKVGDSLLRLVAQRLQRAIREGDILARLGGDEFVLLASCSGAAESRVSDAAEALGKRIIDTLSRPFLVESSTVDVGASVGIAHFPIHGRTSDEIMRRADLALYSAKTAGGNTMRVFLPEAATQAKAQREMETDFHKALALNQLSILYQPRMDIRAGTVTGFEALLLWSHPVHGVIPAAAFIPTAEERGCSAQLGDWMLRKVCLEAARWPSNLTIALKMSPRQLAEPQAFYTAVQAALGASGLAPHRLELEITKSMPVDPHSGVLNVLHRLRADGVRIAVDDLDMGCSSLSRQESFEIGTVLQLTKPVHPAMRAALQPEQSARTAVINPSSVVTGP